MSSSDDTLVSEIEGRTEHLGRPFKMPLSPRLYRVQILSVSKPCTKDVRKFLAIFLFFACCLIETFDEKANNNCVHKLKFKNSNILTKYLV